MYKEGFDYSTVIVTSVLLNAPASTLDDERHSFRPPRQNFSLISPTIGIHGPPVGFLTHDASNLS